MEHVLYVVSRVFGTLFTNLGTAVPPFTRLLYLFEKPLLLIPVCCLIIGFSVGLIKRIIHS